MLRWSAWALASAAALWSVACAPGESQTTGECVDCRPRASVFATRGMVSSLHPLATQVGLDVLRRGGNAVDAAIAVNAATGVLLPTGNGVGGDLFALIWMAGEGRLYGLNASGRAPMGLTLEMLREAAGADTLPSHGPLTAITVPGAVDGWFTMHERFGSVPMRALLAPAIRYAREGAPGRGWGRPSHLVDEPGFAETFLPGGQGPRPGEPFRNPDLARTLETVAEGGRAAFYEGPIAERVESFCARVGCYLTRADFARQRAEWVEPVGVDFHGYRVWQIPPNGQGLSVLQMLRVLEPYDLAAMGHNSPAYLHHLIEAKKLAFEDRARLYADSRFVDVPVAALLDDAYVARQRERLDPERAATGHPPDDPRTLRPETTYLTVADSAGNMVSLIQSNYWGFGSGLVPDGLGFGLQNRAAQFSLEEGHANVYAPGKRPFHTIIPGFVTRDGRAYMAFGSTGGDMQPQVHVQALLNHIVFGMDVQAAGDAARFRHHGSSDPRGGPAMADGGCVALEPRLEERAGPALRRMGHTLCGPDAAVGGRYLAILRHPETGVYWGATESRDWGQVAGW